MNELFWPIVFLNPIDEKNPKLIEIYKQKMSEYFERAEYLKKGVLSKNQANDTVNAGGGTGQASKKKYEFWQYQSSLF